MHFTQKQLAFITVIKYFHFYFIGDWKKKLIVMQLFTKKKNEMYDSIIMLTIQCPNCTSKSLSSTKMNSVEYQNVAPLSITLK